METIRFEVKNPIVLIIAAIVGLLVYVAAGAAYTRYLAHEINTKKQELSDSENALKNTLNILDATRKELSDTQQQLATLRNQVDRITQILNTTPAPVILENLSSGTTYFYADGRQVCRDGCVIALQPGTEQHFLEAFTYYGDPSSSQPYVTPKAAIYFQPGVIRRYLACGMMGIPGSNCGLF